jgi:hypothetical protein
MPHKNKQVEMVKYSISNVTEINIASSKTKSAATLNITPNKNIIERIESRAVIERTEKATMIDAKRKKVSALVIVHSPELGITNLRFTNYKIQTSNYTQLTFANKSLFHETF